MLEIYNNSIVLDNGLGLETREEGKLKNNTGEASLQPITRELTVYEPHIQ